jgi:chemotaxis signal transduction protein
VTAAALGQGQLLTFALAGAEYAVPLLRVQEILEYEPVTRIPTTPPFVLGVVDLRGRVVPVMDVAAKLGLGRSSITKRSCIVFADIELAAQNVVIGLLVDAVRDVVELAPEQAAAWASDAAASAGECWRELALGGAPLRVIDLEATLLDDAESESAR